MEKENGYMTVDDDTVNSIEEKMPIESELYELADLFKVFGDSTRIKILYVLYENEMCVFEYCKDLKYDTKRYFSSASCIKAESPC